MDHTETVSAVKTSLLMQGIDLSGPCGAFAITGRVAWLLKGEDWGLIRKTAGQNGCDTPRGRFAVDALLNRVTGETIDCLINAENENRPAWQPTGQADPGLWTAPFDMDPGTPIPIPSPVPAPTPTPVPVPPSAGCPCAGELEGLKQQMDGLLIELHQLRDRVVVPPVYRGSVAGLRIVLTPDPPAK